MAKQLKPVHIKVRAVSLFNKKESDIGILEKAIVKDYQLHINEGNRLRHSTLRNQRVPAIYNSNFVTMATCEELFGANESSTSPSLRPKKHCRLLKSRIIPKSSSNMPVLNPLDTIELYKSNSVFDPKAKNLQPLYYSPKKQASKSSLRANPTTDVHNSLFLKTFTNIKQALHSIPNPSLLSYDNNAYRRIFGYQGHKQLSGNYVLTNT